MLHLLMLRFENDKFVYSFFQTMTRYAQLPNITIYSRFWRG